MTSCHCCGLVQHVPPFPRSAVPVCTRCRTKLRFGSQDRPANALSAAVALSALILFLPAITLPFLRIEQFGHTQENSLLGGIISLLAHDEWFVGLTVFAFSVVLPPLKLAALLVLGTTAGRLRSSVRAGTLRAVEQLGRWGMLDVLLVAVLLAFVKLGDLVEFTAGPGVFAFGTFVLLSLLAAYFFDPHALWDEGPMTNETQPDTPNTDNVASVGNDSERAGTSGGQPPSDLPTARVVPRRRFVWIWLLPLLALVGVGWLVVHGWQQRGTVISVTFAEGHGLKAGDQLRYRGTEAGVIERVVFSDDLNAVKAEVRLQPETKGLAREGSRFWVVRPRVNLTDISGLDTVVGAKYLEVLPGAADAPPQYHFIGLEEAPLRDVRETGGLNIVLQAADASGLTSGSPLYYRQLRVGAVRQLALASDGSAVEVHAYVRPAFRQLVLPKAKFWKTGGVKIRAGWTGLSVDVGSAQTLLQSGIAMAVPTDSQEPVRQGHRFVLHEQPQDEWLAWRPSLGTGTVPDKLPQPTWAILEWTEPGYVYNSDQKCSGWVLSAKGRVIGPVNLLSEPESAKPNTAHLFLAGRRIDVPEEIASVGMSLGQIEADLPGQQVFPLEFREAEPPEDVLIVLDPDQGPVFVSAARLALEDGCWLVDAEVPLDPSWHGAAAVSVADGSVVGLLLLDEEPPRIGLYRRPEPSAENTVPGEGNGDRAAQ